MTKQYEESLAQNSSTPNCMIRFHRADSTSNSPFLCKARQIQLPRAMPCKYAIISIKEISQGIAEMIG
jgi:hypothetical protein